MDSKRKTEIVGLAAQISKNSAQQALEMISAARTSHIGSCLSVIDVLCACLVIKYKTEPNSQVLLSKGHAAAALYAALHELNQLNVDNLSSFSENGSSIYGHVNHHASSWIPLSTGSLGHGLPFGLGMAHGKKIKHENGNIYVVISDGECNEGTTWESALIANKLKLGNLKLIIDRNRFQSLGRTEDIVPLEPLKQKWEAFGWKTIEVDGHDLNEIVEALTQQTEGPVCVIAHTIKGHGVDFMEDKLEWHYRSPNPEQLIEAKSQFRNKSIT